MSKCKNCVNLRNHWCEKVIDSPDPNIERDCEHFNQMTNGDMVRSMTDEELSKQICPAYVKKCSCLHPEQGSCEKCVLEWLKQPAEEVGNTDV